MVVDRRDFDWKATVWAGLISGAVFMIVEMMMVEMFLGMSMWGPPRMIAAIVLGEGVLPPPETFDPVIVTVAMVVHFVLSVVFVIPLVWVIRHMALAPSLLIGAGYGLALYLVNFYLFTALFPWFAMARNWVSIATHILFGIVAALAYGKLRRTEPEIVAPPRSATVG